MPREGSNRETAIAHGGQFTRAPTDQSARRDIPNMRSSDEGPASQKQKEHHGSVIIATFQGEEERGREEHASQGEGKRHGR